MKLSRLIIILIAGWAGLMYYRYHAVAKIFSDSYEEGSSTSDGTSGFGSSSGGIGGVGGIGPVGNNGGYKSTFSAHP